jgi:hypothetical protein
VLVNAICRRWESRWLFLGEDEKGDLQISSVWTALGWMALEASFWPANLGARAMVVGDSLVMG